MPEGRTPHDVLARITSSRELARVVSHLQPEILHAIVARYGLEDCGELLALATPAQLNAALDLDLWKAARAGGDEQFDAGRFGEWLEILVDIGPETAAARLSTMDLAVVVTGLSAHVTVWDPAVFSPVVELSGADAVVGAGAEEALHADIGGYVVIARNVDAWDVIVDALVALDAHHGDVFHRVMRGCRRLSNSGRELDGLDDLLSDDEQGRFELMVSRERRRDERGFLSPPQARAFLESARALSVTAPPGAHPVFVAYQRSLTAETETATQEARESVAEQTADSPGVSPTAVAAVIELLRDAGVMVPATRALLPGMADEPAARNSALNAYLRRCTEADDDQASARQQELAFLANALVGAGSLQGRSFTRQEAMDAAAATCNLGLEHWPSHWGSPSAHALVAMFQLGWSLLHREVLTVAADGLLDAVAQVRSSDRELQMQLFALRRDLQKQRRAGTPWRARARLDVLASLDLPAWAALTSLFDECPVMLANVWTPAGQRVHQVDPARFRFIASRNHIVAVQRFLQSLPGLLVG